ELQSAGSALSEAAAAVDNGGGNGRPHSSFLPTQQRRVVILSAAGAKDLLPQQILRYARVPRASLRMTKPLGSWQRRKKGKQVTVVRSAFETSPPPSRPKHGYVLRLA